jgi:hypothetical protein
MKQLDQFFGLIYKPFDDRGFGVFRNEHPAESEEELFHHTQPHQHLEDNPVAAINHYECYLR